MSYKLRTTDNFDKNLKRLGKRYKSLKTDYASFLDELERNPTNGIALGKSCYKVRMAISSKNKGKSGGARVITCVKIVNETVYLLSIYDKSEQDSISQNDLDNLLELAGLA